MLKTRFIAASIALALAAPAMAEDAHHPEEKQQKPPAAKPVPKAAPKCGAGMANMAPMRDNMKRMQDEMARIRASTDPKEKERLIEEHFKTMEQSMSMMQAMMGSGMGMGSGSQPAK